MICQQSLNSELEKNSIEKRNTDLSQYAGFTGFINCLDKEWPQVNCRTLHFDQTFYQSIATAFPQNNDPEKNQSYLQCLINELNNPQSQTEVYYQKSERLIPELIEHELAEDALSQTQVDDSTKLTKNSVVLVLGGAQGITAEIIKTLSQIVPCQYLLIGRSPSPESSPLTRESGPYGHLEDLSDIRAALITSGNIKKPSELEATAHKIYKANQITTSLKSLRNNGANGEYISLDISDPDKLQQFIEQTYEQRGRIDGVIHAAGILDDRHIHHKTPGIFFAGLRHQGKTDASALRSLAQGFEIYGAVLKHCFRRRQSRSNRLCRSQRSLRLLRQSVK